MSSPLYPQIGAREDMKNKKPAFLVASPGSRSYHLKLDGDPIASPCRRGERAARTNSPHVFKSRGTVMAEKDPAQELKDALKLAKSGKKVRFAFIQKGSGGTLLLCPMSQKLPKD